MLLSWVRLKTPQSSRKDAHIPIPYWPRRPPQPLSRSDLVRWHRTDMPTLLSDVRCWDQSRKHLLAASISPFDPQETSVAPQCPPAAGLGRSSPGAASQLTTGSGLHQPTNP